jgi:transcriptional regulator with XRE-family HTH domain
MHERSSPLPKKRTIPPNNRDFMDLTRLFCPNRRRGVDKQLNVEYLCNMSTSFGTKLRDIRRQAGISQRTLAEKVGLDFSYISKLENDRLAAPAAETVVRLANLLGCPAEDLLSAAQKMPQNVESALSSEPAAIRFLSEASELNLSSDEWEKMRGTLRSLRSDQMRRKRK